MTNQVIICPYCHKEIPLSEALSHQIKEELRKEFDTEVKKKEQDLAQKEQGLIKKERSLEEEYARKLKLEKARLEEESKQKAKESVAIELEDLHEQLKEKEQKLQESQKAELEFRKQRRELEEKQKSIELEMARKLDEEREKIREEAVKSVSEQQRLKDLEKDKKISDMLRQIEDLKRKAEQGSQQTQGEVLELEIEEILTNNFPFDQIEPVAKGKRGADILQRVYNQYGQCCGTIIWESKRTKLWNDIWIEKLKDDQREAKAEIAVLVTTALPKEVNNFAYINGVWVTSYTLAICLAVSLRMNLIQIASAKMSAVGVGKYEKMEVLYGYLSGPEFGQRVEAIASAFGSMKNDLDQEKRAMTKIWAKREKQIERVINNISGMYGDMQGIIGASLPQIKSLELTALITEGES
ncbi:MAG: DUF2130 domain-containing protein [Deltaproteobacteria bacterium]|nr:DUF2130 domain-containing protein [Deltaproteobacteria bacterium]